MEWYIFIEFGVLVAFLVYWAISSIRMENRIDELENEKREWKKICKAERKRIHEAERKIDAASRNALIKKWIDYAEGYKWVEHAVPSKDELDAMTDRQFLRLMGCYIRACNDDIAKTELNDTRNREHIRSQYMVSLAWVYASRAGWLDNWETKGE